MHSRIRSALRHVLRERPAQRTAKANELHKEGARAEERSDWRAAAECYRKAMLINFHDPQHQLRLAMALDKLGRGDEAKAHALVAIDATLNARYDALAALRVHPTFFAARDEMANFILDNAAELASRIETRMATPAASAAGPTKVFVYWDKPETMPAIVQACRSSLRRFVDGGFELIELDESNIDAFVSIADSVREQLSDNPAHFSDYLRSRLLQDHGGLWLDSTCLLTQPLSSVVAPLHDQDAFLFTYSGSRVGSWFFWSRPDAYVVNAVTEVEVLWWETRGRLTNYFMWHDIVEMLYWTDPQYKQAWESMRKHHPRAALALLRDLEKPFDAERYSLALEGSGIHKLTHKLPAAAVTGETLASHILNTW